MPRGPIIPPLPKTPLLENPFFQLETFRYISQRNLLRFIQRLIELRDPSKPLEERKSGYIISRGRALASLDHLLKQLGYLQSLSRGKRNKRRGIALWW